MSAARAAALRAQADALEAQARALRAEADALDVDVAAPANDDGAVETIAQFARRYGWSTRHVGGLLGQGLPSVGAGKARRVRSRAADAWLVERAKVPSAKPEDDPVVEAARAAARRGR